VSAAIDETLLRRAAEAAAASPGLGWLAGLRTTGLAQFVAEGLPGTAEEDWKYTDISPLARGAGGPAAPDAADAIAAAARLAGAAAARAVFADGRFVAGRSELPRAGGAVVQPFSRLAPAEAAGIAARLAQPGEFDRRLDALNVALLADGLSIDIGPGEQVADAIHVLFTGSGRLAQNRLVINVGAGSRCLVVEHHAGVAGSASNTVTSVRVGAGAELRYVKLQSEADGSTHVAAQHFALEAGARVQLLHLDLGAGLARNDLSVHLDGPQASVESAGLFLADGARHLDNHTRIEHRAPSTTSREAWRGIADGRGRGVFNGKVVVRPGADKADARLTSQNLLLSAGSEIDTKPELEIYADEVKCSHGATVGQLDPAAVFYLRSRGIPQPEARRMLIAAFARQLLMQLPSPALEAQVMAVLSDRLPDLREVASAP